MKSPSFQFYVENFLVGTKDFTSEQVGGYVLLMCEQWDKGGVPDDDRELLRISRMKKNALPAVKKKFKKNKKNLLLLNTRLEKERKKQKEWKKKSAEAGIKSGVSRRNKRTKVEPKTNQPSTNLPDLVQPNANSLSASSSSTLVSSSSGIGQVFEILRQKATKEFSDDRILREAKSLLKKYPNPTNIGALCNTWVSNMSPDDSEDAIKKLANAM